MSRTILLLVCSNLFMTFAWYGHLRQKQSALWAAIIVSWLIAFFEYCFQVPANRIGHNAGLSAAKLKTIQEVITLVIFVFFAQWYLKEPIRWNVIAGFACIAMGATLVFAPWMNTGEPAEETAADAEPALVSSAFSGSPHPAATSPGADSTP